MKKSFHSSHISFLFGHQVCTQAQMLFFTNYDGGILNINVDVNIPNLKIGIVN